MTWTSEKRLQLVFYNLPDAWSAVHKKQVWIIECPELKKSLRANTQKQALVAMANALKRIKKEKLDEALCPNLK